MVTYNEAHEYARHIPKSDGHDVAKGEEFFTTVKGPQLSSEEIRDVKDSYRSLWIVMVVMYDTDSGPRETVKSIGVWGDPVAYHLGKMNRVQ